MSMNKGKRVSAKRYKLGKSMAELTKSSPYLTKKQKKKQIRNIFNKM